MVTWPSVTRIWMFDEGESYGISDSDSDSDPDSDGVVEEKE